MLRSKIKGEVQVLLGAITVSCIALPTERKNAKRYEMIFRFLAAYNNQSYNYTLR